MDLADYLAGAFSFQNRPQEIGQWGLNNLTSAYNSFPGQLQNAMAGNFATNILNSQNIQNLRNAQAQTARGFYDAAGSTNAAQSTSNALIEQARQQAQGVSQQAAAEIAAAQAQAEAAREVARLQSESALEQERLRQTTAQGKTQALGPLLSAVLGIFGRNNVAGSGGTTGGVQTDYGAGVNLGGSGAQPTNAAQFRANVVPSGIMPAAMQSRRRPAMAM